MANFSDLPNEIQLLVARDLSESHLNSLNSLFFNQWMDTKWETVTVDLRYPDWAVRLLQRMVDPFVATRPKTLTFNIDQREPPSSPKQAISTVPKAEPQTFDGAMTVLLDSLPLLPNITCLTIDVFEKLTFDVATFFERIASLSFARKLFQSLTELNLYLLTDNQVTQTKLSLSLEHFLRSLAPTLRRLHIWTAIDLCPLFNALSQPLSLSQSHPSVPFPNLTTLSHHFDMSLLSDPQSLCRFLLIHNNLQHLHLRVHSDSNPEIEGSLAALLAELVNNNDQFPSLRTLDIYPTMTQAGLSALLTLIKRSAPTLTSLVIPVHYLTDEEANRVIDALTEDEVRVPGMTTTTTQEERRKLKSLEMWITCLSVPFLDLLARKLPQLERLDLLVNNITGSDEHSFYEQLSQRRYDPDITDSQDILHAWKLQSFSIYWDWDNEIQSKRAERAVMGAIPALAYRWGDMDSDDEGE